MKITIATHYLQLANALFTTGQTKKPALLPNIGHQNTDEIYMYKLNYIELDLLSN